MLANAKKRADENTGYYVFDEKGNSIYPPKPAKKTVVYAESKNNSLAGNYKVTASNGLNMRYVPGDLADENIILAIPQGAVVQNYGYFTSVDGVKWLYVAYKNKVGFIHSKYVKKV